MSWQIKRDRRVVKPYYWEIFLSSHGMATGRAWTRKRAERALSLAQAWLLSGSDW